MNVSEILPKISIHMEKKDDQSNSIDIPYQEKGVVKKTRAIKIVRTHIFSRGPDLLFP